MYTCSLDLEWIHQQNPLIFPHTSEILLFWADIIWGDEKILRILDQFDMDWKYECGYRDISIQLKDIFMTPTIMLSIMCGCIHMFELS